MLSCGRRNILAMLLVLFVIAGCGGGGGGNSAPNVAPSPAPNAPLPTDPSASEVTFQVNPNEEVKKTVGEVEINVPANTFTQTSTVTVKLTSPSDKPTSLDVNIVGNEIEFSSTAEPTGDIIFTMPKSEQHSLKSLSASSPFEPLYRPLSYINGAWKVVGKAVASYETVRVSIRPDQLIFQGAVYSLKMVLAKVEIDLPGSSTEPGILEIAGTGRYENRGVVLVHGINSTAESMKLLGETLVQKGVYKKAGSFAYDWRLPTDYSAKMLRDYLEAIVHNGPVDLIAHSRGGLICRHMCEVLGANKSVRKLVLICTPNEGSKWDSAAEFVDGLEDNFFNTPNAGGFPLVDTPAVRELIRSSEVVQNLRVNHGYSSSVNYCLIAAWFDPFVSTDSALAQGTDIDAFTTGSVTRKSLMGSHSSLVNSESGIESLIESIRD